jgi:hypothetical protein
MGKLHPSEWEEVIDMMIKNEENSEGADTNGRDS